MRRRDELQEPTGGEAEISSLSDSSRSSSSVREWLSEGEYNRWI